jgi:hypothetical protein
MNFVFAIILLVASYAIQALMQPKPVNAKPAAFDDFDLPVVDEGSPQAVVFGDVWSPDWMVLWFGNYRTVSIRK